MEIINRNQLSKGFTLNHENNNLNHNSLCKIVKTQIIQLTIVNQNKITRKNKETVKKYYEILFKLGYDKRVIKSVNEDCTSRHNCAANTVYFMDPW